MEPSSTSQKDLNEGLTTLRNSDPDSIDSNEGSAIEALEAELYDYQVETEQGKFFIPEGTLERIINQDRIQPAIDECLPALTKDRSLQ